MDPFLSAGEHIFQKVKSTNIFFFFHKIVILLICLESNLQFPFLWGKKNNSMARWGGGVLFFCIENTELLISIMCYLTNLCSLWAQRVVVPTCALVGRNTRLKALGTSQRAEGWGRKEVTSRLGWVVEMVRGHRCPKDDIGGFFTTVN